MDPLDEQSRAALTPPGVHYVDGHDAVQHEKDKVGNLLRLTREYNDIFEQLTLDPQNNHLSLQLAGKNTEITLQKNALTSFENLLNIKLSTSDDIFLEVLMGNVKGAIIGYQQWVKRIENSLKTRLVNRLNELKLNRDVNFDEIANTERELLEITDKEISEKAKNLKIFECLNAEKPTPLFMSLARCRSTGKKLSAIQKDDGTNYGSDRERNEGIVQYYEKLYEKPIDERINYENCIEDFLGAEVLNNPIVQNSFLTETEIASLDRPLSIDELDKSIEKANMKSAPGVDGLSNKFIRRYWLFFRTALYRYCLDCFQKGSLTANFLNASIKLIPKKGNITELKNWRPISLLSNMYKVISRAINNRLSTVVNRICSRAQKGFNDSRFTQECLINVLETIRHCNNNNISGAVVAVDMAKAFDTLSHGYMEEVFKFFRMGPAIRKWLRILGTNRTACIILDDCSYSRNFRLGRGAAQGDNISPDCFNFGDQILIFKIELDPQITGVWQNFLIPPIVPALPENNAPPPQNALAHNNNSFFSCESARETGKNESMADDNTTIMLQTTENFHNLRRILDDFAKVSGLTCNFDKTCVLKIGPDTPDLDMAALSKNAALG